MEEIREQVVCIVRDALDERLSSIESHNKDFERKIAVAEHRAKVAEGSLSECDAKRMECVQLSAIAGERLRRIEEMESKVREMESEMLLMKHDVAQSNRQAGAFEERALTAEEKLRDHLHRSSAPPIAGRQFEKDGEELIESVIRGTSMRYTYTGHTNYSADFCILIPDSDGNEHSLLVDMKNSKKHPLPVQEIDKARRDMAAQGAIGCLLVLNNRDPSACLLPKSEQAIDPRIVCCAYSERALFSGISHILLHTSIKKSTPNSVENDALLTAARTITSLRRFTDLVMPTVKDYESHHRAKNVALENFKGSIETLPDADLAVHLNSIITEPGMKRIRGRASNH